MICREDGTICPAQHPVLCVCPIASLWCHFVSPPPLSCHFCKLNLSSKGLVRLNIIVSGLRWWRSDFLLFSYVRLSFLQRIIWKGMCWLCASLHCSLIISTPVDLLISRISSFIRRCGTKLWSVSFRPCEFAAVPPQSFPSSSRTTLKQSSSGKAACVLILSLYRPIFKVRSWFNGGFRWWRISFVKLFLFWVSW